MTFKPYLKYRASGIEWLGDVPLEWDVLPLFAVMSERYVKNSGNRVSEVLSLSYGRIVIRDVESNHGLLPESFETYQIVEPGDVILRLTDLQNDQRSLRVGQVISRGIITSAYVCVSATPRINQSYAYLLLHVFDTMKQFYGLGGGVRQTMKFSDLKRVPLLIPPLKVQSAISTFLAHETAKIDTLIAKQEAMIELLNEKRKAVISHAVTKGLDPSVPMKASGVEWLGEVPEHWKIKRLKHISPQQAVGIVVNPSEFVEDEGKPFIYGGDIQEGKVNLDTRRRIGERGNSKNPKSVLRTGDLLTVRVGAPGITAVVPPELDGGNCASVMIIRKSRDFVSDWLCYAMNSRSVKCQVEIVQYGAAQEQFNIGHAVNFLIATPPYDEQYSIVLHLNRACLRIDALIAKAQQAIALQKEHRTALISAAVTGKIDVRNEVAERKAA